MVSFHGGGRPKVVVEERYEDIAKDSLGGTNIAISYCHSRRNEATLEKTYPQVSHPHNIRAVQCN